MKPNKRTGRKDRAAAAPAAPAPARTRPWLPYAILTLAAVLVWWAYAPSLHGPFLFDDTALQFALPGFDLPLTSWFPTVRPLLMFTYWVNTKISGEDPYSYHIVNLLFHCIASGMIFLIVRRLAEWAAIEPARRSLAAGFASAVFLLHPLSTEAVAYLAGRSEVLSVMLLLAAYTVFVYRPGAAISWVRMAALLVLFGGALASKEHTVVLPALLLLTDLWWNKGSWFERIRHNWRLYIPMAAGAVFLVTRYWGFITSASDVSAGFGMKDLTWYQYFFTQCRAVFVYLRLFVFPVGQTADWDFPISKTILDHGAIVGLAALLALAGLAWRCRRQYPLASFGFFAFLLLLAPTSSILPIKDPFAERRLYLAMPGLLLILAELIGRVKVERKTLRATACAAVLLLTIATHARAEVWSSAVALWQDAAQKSPNKPRVHFQLANSYCGAPCGGADEGTPRCDQAIAEYEKTAQLQKPTYNLLVDWGLAYECLNQPDKALAKLEQAAALEKTAHVYTQMAKVYGEHQQWAEALDALATAEKLEPGYAVIYAYRGLIDYATNRTAAAVADYQRALALDPSLQPAHAGLAQAQARLGASR